MWGRLGEDLGDDGAAKVGLEVSACGDCGALSEGRRRLRMRQCFRIGGQFVIMKRLEPNHYFVPLIPPLTLKRVNHLLEDFFE